MPRRATVLLLTALLALSLYVEPSCATDSLGVVLLHDKNAAPERYFGELSRVLRNVGFLVAMPELPWSSKRGFDATFQQALVEMGMAAEELRMAGAKRIVLVGHGLGANAALAFAATRSGVDAIVALAPSHDPELHREVFLPDVRKARSMLNTPGPQRRSMFTDFNLDKDYDLSTTAEVYLSFNDPGGEAVMPRNCAALIHPVPLLWVVGEFDPLSRLGRNYAFAKAPPHPLSRYEQVPADHQNTPAMAARLVGVWLRELVEHEIPR